MNAPAPREIDTTVAHNARVWNYWLGGKDNYAADREAGAAVQEMFPSIVDVARADRAFLGRAMRFLTAEAGLRQFLDIGTGLPTSSNTHQVAQQIAPESVIVYVDNDPIVLAHARALLTSTREGRTVFIDADAHQPEDILRRAVYTLDLDRPVGIMLLGLLNFILDTEEAVQIVRTLVDAAAPGSYLAITHPTVELGGEANVKAMAFWNENARPPITARTREEFTRFFDGLELLDPGIVPCSQWRPDLKDVGGTAAAVPQFGAVGRKP